MTESTSPTTTTERDAARADGRRFLTEDEVANLTGHRRAAVARWRELGFGPASCRLSGRLVYRREVVEAWAKAIGLPLRQPYTTTPADGPVVCEPWCAEGDGHRGPFREDQVCWSASIRIDLSLEPLLPDLDGCWASNAEVYRLRHTDGQAQINIGMNGEYDIRMTPGEAAALRDALSAVLALE